MFRWPCGELVYYRSVEVFANEFFHYVEASPIHCTAPVPH